MLKDIFNPKIFSVINRDYTRKQFTADLLAGIVVGIVALPLAIAFAVASGVSPERGLVTAVMAGFLISFLGGSRVQIGGPTGAFIVIIVGIIAQYGLNGLLISTIMAGFILIAFGLLKLGSLLKYFPHPLIVGFTSGIAVVIFSTQVKDALGLEITELPSGFIEKWGSYFNNLSTLNLYAIAITVITILLVVFAKRFFSKIPGSIIAIIVGTAAVQLFQLPVSTIESFFGEIPNTFHLEMPQFNFNELGNYVQPAITIAFLGAIESLLSAVVSDGMIGANHRSNTELIAQGVANVVTPFFGGIPATGAIARTATNVKNGGKTPIAGIIHAVTLLLIMLFFGKWVKLIPMSVLAGILIVVAYNMSEWRTFVSILKGSVFDIIVLVTTFSLTVLVDLTVAIQVGIILSAILFMKRMADLGNVIPERMESDMIDDYSKYPSEIGIYEISGPLFFASAKEFCEVLKSVGYTKKIMVIRMRHVPFIDATGLRNFKDAIESLMDSGIKIILSGVNDNVCRDLKTKNIVDLVGNENIYNTFDLAIDAATTLAEKTGKKRKSI
jgi:SulP family sulfate permease